MTKLAAWSMEARDGEGALQRPKPTRVDRSHIALERHLEDWIASDMTLIAEGLTLVGRQVTMDDWRLDLLAIDARDRWVVIEIKPRTLDSGALAQALYYAASLDADELFGKLEARLGDFGDPEQLSASVKQQQEGEGERREIAVLLVGAGIHPGVPISGVSFEVFELDGGPQLLVREVVEEPAAPPRRRRLTVEAIRRRAMEFGVGTQFDRFVRMAEAARLAVQPQQQSVRIAPRADRRQFLMYARPRCGDAGGELLVEVGPKQFVEFFDHLDEQEAVDALGEVNGVCGGGEALDAVLDRIERFLTEQLPQPDPDGGERADRLEAKND